MRHRHLHRRAEHRYREPRSCGGV